MKIIKAFTLIEMLIVVGIIGILVSLASPAIYESMATARLVKQEANIKTLQDAEARYQIELLKHGYTEADFKKNIVLD